MFFLEVCCLTMQEQHFPKKSIINSVFILEIVRFFFNFASLEYGFRVIAQFVASHMGK